MSEVKIKSKRYTFKKENNPLQLSKPKLAPVDLKNTIAEVNQVTLTAVDQFKTNLKAEKLRLLKNKS